MKQPTPSQFRNSTLPVLAALASIFVINIAVGQTNCAPAPSGLVSWWRAEGNTFDQIGTNNGTLVDNATFGPGRVGQAFVLDGNDDAIPVGNPPELQLQNLTIEAWVKRGSSSVASGTPWGGLIFSCPWAGYGVGMLDNGMLYFGKIGYSAVQTS